MCLYTRSQVSVYRTIGPFVFALAKILFSHDVAHMGFRQGDIDQAIPILKLFTIAQSWPPSPLKVVLTGIFHLFTIATCLSVPI